MFAGFFGVIVELDGQLCDLNIQGFDYNLS
jgi:hypothetical protein